MFTYGRHPLSGCCMCPALWPADSRSGIAWILRDFNPICLTGINVAEVMCNTLCGISTRSLSHGAIPQEEMIDQMRSMNPEIPCDSCRVGKHARFLYVKEG